MSKRGRKTTVICPAWTPAQIARRLETGTLRYADAQLEKRCSRCREYLPADTEFFMTTHQGQRLDLHTWCKCCYAERRPYRNPNWVTEAA